LIFLAVVARADEGNGILVVTAVDGNGAPVADVAVTIAGAAGATRTGRSNGAGEARFEGVATGDYRVAATFGAVTSQQSVTVAPGEETRRTMRIDLQAAAEVVRVVEPKVSREAPPLLVPGSMTKQLPYSDETIDQNVYAVVWLLLCIDVEGAVQRAEVLKSPAGLGLEPIAVAEAKKLRFRPATDASGRPIESKLLWALEWAPYWSTRFERGGKSRAMCAGSGPLPLDLLGSLIEVVYKDCSPPKGYERVPLLNQRPAPLPAPSYQRGKQMHGPPPNNTR
jgi:hypothetical protein